MKRYFLFFSLLIASAVTAQSELLHGLYEAENTSLLTYYSGDWVQVVDGAYSVMESTTEGDSVSFNVSGSQIVIYRELLVLGAEAEICIDSVCSTFANDSSLDTRGVPIAFPISDDAEVEITNNGGTLRLDSFLVLSTPELSQAPSPDPAREYVQLADGKLAAIDRTITGGEVVQVGLSAATVALLLILVAVVAWKK